jgi:hypothetical protein
MDCKGAFMVAIVRRRDASVNAQLQRRRHADVRCAESESAPLWADTKNQGPVTMPDFRRYAAIALAVTGLLAQLPAAAQSNLLDKAKGTIDKYGSSSSGSTAAGGGLSNAEIGRGLKEALTVGTERVVGQVGARGGYFDDQAIHIPLPKKLQQAKQALDMAGMGDMADDLELRLNRAAEAAAPEAQALFVDAIAKLELADVERIYNGRKDEATRYFKRQMKKPLGQRMGPIVDRSLADVGAIRSYDDMMGQYKNLPLVPDVKADLTGYVVEKAMDGLFYYVAKEEAAIRSNPAERTTELLQRVFGQ